MTKARVLYFDHQCPVVTVSVVMFVSKDTRRVMTLQIQAIANFNNVQKTCQLSDSRLATASDARTDSARRRCCDAVDNSPQTSGEQQLFAYVRRQIQN